MKTACNISDAATAGRTAYLIGAGIAALATAVYLIRDAHWPGKNIHIFEELSVTGGSCDGSGTSEIGYVIRGGRMLNYTTYECTWNLLESIPALTDPLKSVKDEILAFNNRIKTYAHARLVDKNAQIIDVSSMGFSHKDRSDLAKLAIIPEEAISNSTIEQWFSPGFFKTPFWYMWATMFAFQPWHSAVEFKRYLLRFMHEFPRINTLAGVVRTPYNQFDSLILPITNWLIEQGVQFNRNCLVTDLDFTSSLLAKAVERIYYCTHGNDKEITVNAHDLVFITNGSITEGSCLGSMHSPPCLGDKAASFTLWEKIAKRQPGMGAPSIFANHIHKTLWESFTVTCKNPVFFKLMENFSGNKPGTGALVTFKDSNWLLSIVLAYQPHFINQPDSVKVFWGYALFPEMTGNYIPKKMTDCTGEEILIELCSHLKFNKELPLILETANCIPCLMPFITSQFMPRSTGDRPPVVPKDATNFAFIGQFTEMADDVVFTVEYSVRSAQTAVYSLLKLPKRVVPINQPQYDMRVLFETLTTSFR